MILRNFCRFIIPAAYQTSKPATVRTLTQVELRWYSQQENVGNLPVVEFDYVKKASSRNDVTIIDVREPDEIKEHGKIPNSVNIPLGQINEALSMSEKAFQNKFDIKKPNQNSELIFYCMIGRRSEKAQENAHRLGYKNVKNYLGSWTEWASKT